MGFENLIVKGEGAVTRITLNRPERRNALSLALMQELIAALKAVDTQVVVIEGAGPGFSAGHDLSEMTGRPLVFYQELFTVCTELMETLQGIPAPVIAKVHGMATAAGCQLVAACDLAVAEEGFCAFRERAPPPGGGECPLSRLPGPRPWNSPSPTSSSWGRPPPPATRRWSAPGAG